MRLNREPAFQEAVRRIHESPRLSGLTTTARAIYSVLLWQVTERPLLIVVDGNKQAEALFEAIETFFPLLNPSRESLRPQLLPALDTAPGQAMSPHAEILEKRAVGLCRLASERVSITVTPIASALLRIQPAAFYRQLYNTLRVDEEVPLEELIAHLESIGYQKRDPVEMVGEYSVRGGILDVFSPEASHPVRIELFGDLIESIRRFEVESQRSVLKLNECTLLPLTEFQKSRACAGASLRTSYAKRACLRAIYPWMARLSRVGRCWRRWCEPRTSTLLALLEKPIVIWDEPDLTRSAAERLWKRLHGDERKQYCPPEKVFLEYEELRATASGASHLEMRELDTNPDGIAHCDASFHGVPWQHAGGYRGSAQPGGSRQSGRVLLRHDGRS